MKLLSKTAWSFLFLVAAGSLATPFARELLPSTPARAELDYKTIRKATLAAQHDLAGVPGIAIDPVGAPAGGYYDNGRAKAAAILNSGAKVDDAAFAPEMFILTDPAYATEYECPQTWLGYMRIVTDTGCHAVWCPRCWEAELKSRNRPKYRPTADAAIVKWPE